MAEPDLTPLARAWADRTTEPDFDALVTRAHARRRRRALSLVASAAAVLLVVGLSAALLQRGPSAALMPTHHHPARVDHTRDPSWIVAHGHLMSWMAGLGGWTSTSGAPPDVPDRVLTVWQQCQTENTGCHSAWRLTDWQGKEVAAGPAPAAADYGSSPNAHAWGDVFVVKAWNRRGIVVSPDGTTRPLREVASGTISPGDLLVRSRQGFAVADPRAATAWPLDVPGSGDGAAVATVSSDGTLWLMSASGHRAVTLRWLRHGSWHEHVLAQATPGTGGPPMPGVLATAGHHVVAMSSFDGATVLPVGTFAVSADDGKTWTDLTKGRLPFDAVDTIAATDGGTLYVGGYARGRYAGLFRSTDTTWTHFEAVPGSQDDAGLQPAGPVVLAFSGQWRHPRLVAYDDHGARTDVPIR